MKDNNYSYKKGKTKEEKINKLFENIRILKKIITNINKIFHSK